MKLAVIGTGYLGATHAACMTLLGHEVLGVDVDLEKLAQLSRGELPFFEPGLSEILVKARNDGSLRFTSSYQEAADFADVYFIAVGTPQKSGEYSADLSALESVIYQLAPLVDKPAVILGKSTVPVGTAERLARVASELSPAGPGLELAWNPEFLREGFAVADTLSPDRLVLGVDPQCRGRAEQVTREIYSRLIEDEVPFIVTDLATSELVKVAANAFLATKISFINAVADVCEAAGADVSVLATAIGYDVRIGPHYLNAGLGFGGGCLPKDIRGFIARAGELGVDDALTFLREVDNINARRRTRLVEVARQACGGSLMGRRVTVLGAAFKPNSDDVRDSPALSVAGQIHLQGAIVSVFDPKAMENSRRIFPTLNYTDSASAACAEADLVLLLTEWDEFRSLDPVELKSRVNVPTIIDGRNCLDPAEWRKAGWTYRGFGRRPA